MINMMVVIHSLAGGGAERVVVNLLKAMDRRDFSITLVLFEGYFDYTPPDNVEISILQVPSSTNILKQTRGFILKIFLLARLIRKKKPDIILSLISAANIITILADSLSGMQSKVIVVEQNNPSESLKNDRYGSITGPLMKYFYPKAERIIAASEGIKNDLSRNFGLPEAMIDLIYNPVDIEEIELLSREEVTHPWFHENVPILVSVGRLTKQKGYPYLISAFSLVKQTLPCRLLIIGSGEDKGTLLQAVNELGLSNDIEFLGFQRNPFKYMARSGLFILSSLYEGFGNVIVEAMALGLPVISTDCKSGPSEIIENRKNGVLVPIKDEKALAEAILDVLTNNGLRRYLCEGARRRSHFFALGPSVEQYSNIFFKTVHVEKR
jgi:glycosyltransferase involved in cell wall biosynthesis